MNDVTREIQTRLLQWFDEGDTKALDAACALTKSAAVDIARLLQWLDHEAIADDAARDLATRRLRRALGLPMMPGAVCRPAPR